MLHFRFELAIYDRYENNLRAFEISVSGYKPIPLSEQRFWIQSLGLGLGLWQGVYQGTEGLWLRWYDQTGWVQTLAEMAEAERQRAEAESQRAEAESQRAEAERHRADRLAEYLRSQGLDPDNLPV